MQFTSKLVDVPSMWGLGSEPTAVAVNLPTGAPRPQVTVRVLAESPVVEQSVPAMGELQDSFS
jgi:hypothetical protein